MTRSLLAAMVAAALVGGVALADGTDVKQKAEALVKQLASDDADVREKATDELSKLGPEAAPVLEEASKSSDPEVAWRAEKALAAVRKPADSQDGEEQAQKPPAPQRQAQRRGFSSTFSMHIGGPGSFSMSTDSSGHVTVNVTEKDKDGNDVQKSYSADSVEDFQQKYPDVAKKYGIGKSSIVQLPQGLQAPDLQDLDKQIEELDKQMEELFKGLGQGPGLGKDFAQRMKDLLGQARKRRQVQPPQPAPPDDEEQTETPPQPAKPPAEPAKPPEPQAQSNGEFGAEVSFIDETLRDQLDLQGDAGVVVQSVAKDSPAAKSGLEAHDVVLSVNGEPVKTKWDFRRLLLEGAKGGKVELEVVRKGEKKTLTIDPSLLGK